MESDEEMVEYGNQLRRSILEAYSEILRGFKNSKLDLRLPHAAHLLQFVEFVFRDTQRYILLLSSLLSTFQFSFYK